jgi:integral membrane sensor domain MASE1
VHSHAWLTWWVGDTVGVLLAGPLLLPLVEAVGMG